MNIRFSLQLLGKLITVLGILMLVPAVCSLIYHEDDLITFLISAAITTSIGVALDKKMNIGRSVEDISRKDGFFIATVSWLTAGIVGAIPFLIYGVFSNPVDAFFESISGFTTTGASVLIDIEALPHGILFWRSMTHWLGGVGIIVLAVAILPRLGVGGMQLMAREGAGPTTEKLSPRIAETAKNLLKIYLLLSAIMAAILFIAGMPIFDSVINMFSTISTGGFSSKNASIGAYDSNSIKIIITVFMFIAGINFALMFGLLRNQFSQFLNNSELRFYLIATITIILVVALELSLRTYAGFWYSLRESAFQVVSIFTGTGFSTVNYDTWPPFTKWIFFVLMFFGGCAGSTTGGLKNIRIMILAKKCYYEVYKLIYPNVVLPIRLGNKTIDNAAVSSITSFFMIYLAIFIIASLLIMADGAPMITALSASAASLGNIGPGFDLVGPASNYAYMSNFTKLLLTLLMLLGRLEIFTILVLFVPAFWKD